MPTFRLHFPVAHRDADVDDALPNSWKERSGQEKPATQEAKL